jgi:carbonic anhydrase
MPPNYPINETPTLRGGGLNNPYVFKQLHFHWGSDDTHGSEHLVDSNPYTHFIILTFFFKTKKIN